MSIMDAWLAGKKRLTAKEVRKLPPGTSIWVHRCYGKNMEHVFGKMTVVIPWGKVRRLRGIDYNGNPYTEPIKPDGEKIGYTLD